MNLLKGLLQSYDGEVTIKYNESNAVFHLTIYFLFAG